MSVSWEKNCKDFTVGPKLTGIYKQHARLVRPDIKLVSKQQIHEPLGPIFYQRRIICILTGHKCSGWPLLIESCKIGGQEKKSHPTLPWKNLTGPFFWQYTGFSLFYFVFLRVELYILHTRNFQAQQSVTWLLKYWAVLVDTWSCRLNWQAKKKT